MKAARKSPTTKDKAREKARAALDNAAKVQRLWITGAYDKGKLMQTETYYSRMEKAERRACDAVAQAVAVGVPLEELR